MPTAIFTRARIRALDHTAAAKYHIPTIVLMENAGRALAHAALTALNSPSASPAPSIIIVCGAGNNGGDGYVAARHLICAGARVVIVAASPLKHLTGDALISARIARAMKIPTTTSIAAAQRTLAAARHPRAAPASILIDALIGTGLSRAITPRSTLARHIVAINAWRASSSRRRVIAADIPSGLDADSGAPLLLASSAPTAVKADLTITFVGPKQGMLSAAAAPFCGRIITADIASPPQLTRALAAVPARKLPSPSHPPASSRSSLRRATS